ncbi:MAG: hypothetical protein E6J34_15350 [Chloroflexi bacterium]|nr:MAG: hypothetical protein E6J34_15350 [Chloroflexota bacterium]
MVVRIASMVLRIAGVLALILGILNWTKVTGDSLRDIHMLLGIIVVLALWVLGALIVSSRGGQGLGIAAFIVGLIVVGFGVRQEAIFPAPNVHWIIQVMHLILGLLAIGMGEMITARYKKRVMVATQKAE